MVSKPSRGITPEEGTETLAMLVPITDKSIKLYRELSEDVWTIQEFDQEGPYREAEVIPIVAPTQEITEEGKYRTYITDAADQTFQHLLESLEATLSLHGEHCEILRCILVRVKRGCKIYPHIDETFGDLSVKQYRMQIVKSSNEPFFNLCNRTTGEDTFIAPRVKELREVPFGSLVAEENMGLDDNIHMLAYVQPKTGQQALKEVVAGWR